MGNAEADYVVYRLKDLTMNPMPGEYNTEHLLKMLFKERVFRKNCL